MKPHGRFLSFVAGSVLCVILAPFTGSAGAQDRAGDDTTQLEAVEVIGTRIKTTSDTGEAPVLSITAEDIERSGIQSIGDILQRLSVSSSSLNTKFNSAGNFGFPADSGGVGSGSTTVSLRNLGAKRVLVLVDGVRWVNESSASGVSAAVDLNTIPASAVERIEILTDGASALYGSDAIAGVINIVTRKKQDGGRMSLYGGDYSTGAGSTKSASLSLGGGADRYDMLFDVSYYEQQRINSFEFGQASFPVPGTGVSNGSSAIPTTRSVFTDPANNTQGGLCPLEDFDGDGTPETAFCNIAGDGTASGPGFTPSFPADFHPFDGGSPTGDRFNFAPFNLLLTPNQRSALFTQFNYELAEDITGWMKGLYQNRESVNQAAPEPIFIGPGAGTGGIADTVGVDASNPFNPFGYALDPASNLIFAGRRPLEGGPRVFTQDVDTRYIAAGVRSSVSVGERTLFVDLNAANGRNRATQLVEGTYNIAHIQRALGPLAGCTAPCVPLNFFGGPGTITQDMLDYIQFTENDRSVQDINLWSANLSGAAWTLPAGDVGVALGAEHRRYSAAYAPDSVVTSGETNGVPSLPTRGSYSVDETYLELGVPVLAGVPAVKSLTVNLATRLSDYSTFGNTTNSKFGFRWEVSDDLVARATVAEGFRAPSVGELFGSPARFDATLIDPCGEATDPAVIANCQAQGVANPATFQQANTQISVRTGGNITLEPETADSLTFGVVYSPAWAEGAAWANRLDFELTYYSHKLDDAIQARDAQTQLDRCAQTNDAAFCTGITRGTSGDINGFNNILQNFGRVETKGYDLGVDWASPPVGPGRISAVWQTTYVTDFTATAKDTGLAEPRTVGVEVNDSAIPEWRSMLRVNWLVQSVEASWALRYISSLTESCGGGNGFAVCDNSAADRNQLDAVTYHDLRALWKRPMGLPVTLAAGINNVLGQDPPECLSCSLNGYDASTYDLPGTFSYLQGSVDF